MGLIRKLCCSLDHFSEMHADDAMAIFVALRSPEVEVIGLTTIYGNVYTTLATRNALHLVYLMRDHFINVILSRY